MVDWRRAPHACCRTPRTFRSPPLRTCGVFAFTFALSLLTGVLFGLAPAWQATSPKLALTLKDHAGNVSAGGGNVRLRKALVDLAGGTLAPDADCRRLFTRSLHNLKNVDLDSAANACSASPSIPRWRVTRRSASANSPRMCRARGSRHAPCAIRRGRRDECHHRRSEHVHHIH